MDGSTTAQNALRASGGLETLAEGVGDEAADEKRVVSAAATDGRNAPGERLRATPIARIRARPRPPPPPPPPCRSRGWTCAWTRWTSFGARRVQAERARARGGGRVRRATLSLSPRRRRADMRGHPRDARIRLRGRLRPPGAGAGARAKAATSSARSRRSRACSWARAAPKTTFARGSRSARDGRLGRAEVKVLAEGAAAAAAAAASSSNARGIRGERPPPSLARRRRRDRRRASGRGRRPIDSLGPGSLPPRRRSRRRRATRARHVFSPSRWTRTPARRSRRSAARTLGACCSTRTSPTGLPAGSPSRWSASFGTAELAAAAWGRRGARGGGDFFGIARGVRRFKRLDAAHAARGTTPEAEIHPRSTRRGGARRSRARVVTLVSALARLRDANPRAVPAPFAEAEAPAKKLAETARGPSRSTRMMKTKTKTLSRCRGVPTTPRVAEPDRAAAGPSPSGRDARRVALALLVSSLEDGGAALAAKALAGPRRRGDLRARDGARRAGETRALAVRCLGRLFTAAPASPERDALVDRFLRRSRARRRSARATCSRASATRSTAPAGEGSENASPPTAAAARTSR